MINNRMYSMISDTHHRQPVKVGLSMRYHFNDRWSLQAGVDYSYHSSDLVLQIENVQIQSEQKLHFVGVPVSLAYSLWSPGRFNVYLSGGGEIEKVVKGSQSIMSMTSNMADRKERQDVEEKPWQISIGGSAGVQFSITKLLSVYAEPGVAYYFDNKSSLPTIYQEKPFNFNINMGLRFDIGK
jgi:long-subunit fatty acid transport protein